MSRMMPTHNTGSSSLKRSPFAAMSGKDILSLTMLLDSSSHGISTVAARGCCTSRLS